MVEDTEMGALKIFHSHKYRTPFFPFGSGCWYEVQCFDKLMSHSP